MAGTGNITIDLEGIPSISADLRAVFGEDKNMTAAQVREADRQIESILKEIRKRKNERKEQNSSRSFAPSPSNIHVWDMGPRRRGFVGGS